MKKGTIWMSLGVLMILLATMLTAYNIYDEKRAGTEVANTIKQMEEIGETASEYTIYPDMEMPTIKIGGRYYIGVLEIPVLDLKLPIIDTWNEMNLKYAPCRYKGSVYKDDLIIAGHNYRSHFQKINQLFIGAELSFRDVDGNVFRYEVTSSEIIQGTDVEQMETGDWDMTLFTCTYGGRTRYTIRCKRIA